MRIAWLTPAAGTSGIVEYSRHVLPEICRRVDAELWSFGQAERFAVGVPEVDLEAEPHRLAELADYDAVVYHLGNHTRFHAQIHATSRLIPGVVVLHDYSLHHFFAGLYISHHRRPDLYRSHMANRYGARGLAVAAAVLGGSEERSWHHVDEVLEHHFIDEALAGARGAIVHSAWHARAVRRHWSGPVGELWLPAYPDQIGVPPTPPCAAAEEIVLMTVGHVERNKQIDRVVATLAADQDLARRIRYVVLGGFDPRSAYMRELNEVIARSGLASRVHLLGYQPSGVFEAQLARADVFVNLRRPNLEGGSASLMEQLAHGRPVVVNATGSFAELPDDVVAKVDAADPDDLGRWLRRLTADGPLRLRMGAAARAFAESRGICRYVEQLLAFLTATESWGAHLTLADRAGRELAALGIDPGLPTSDRVADTLDWLLGPPVTPPVE